jgi:protein-S-isoprenylcysteine O-methyltransferase Ste14
MVGEEQMKGAARDGAANLAANYLATMAVILLGLWVFTRDSNFLSTEFNMRVGFEIGDDTYTIGTPDVLVAVAAFYAVILLPYYALRPGFVCDARRVFLYLREWASKRARPDFGFEERRAALTLALKLYFIPLMLGYLVNNIHEVVRHWNALGSEEPAAAFTIGLNTTFYLLILAVLYLIDIVIFSIGYMVEVRARDNEIKSVDPTVLGWACCLVCYPPFNQAGFAFLSWQQVDTADFATPAIQAMLAWVSISAIAIYAWASVALGLRASNLTNRGIVRTGPYRFVRHPAYVTKNLAAWIVALPALTDALARSWSLALWILVCVILWTLVYVLRALTEERHLLMIDNGYAEYQAKVRYRFVPGLI